ncbi:coatomer gamma subunit Sec21 [Schizosaccharomyces octosporus yFS286]|uniref:Coatomer subunit gamma n=1 Tax=Schizosaccharomyces octosporus (strain yFS286) TaxID=483514 RepID=S9Q452_SCHOY|nr:coatomer gamma subunit Sec21 [Schizosaccharomyces octosporus yFS286]EPX74877.1 coatomer gamma subunit Sec21 [Schizosaccharomyces octosporus yFS286]
MSYSKKDEDNDESIFSNINQVSVTQDARAFHQSSISPRKSRMLLCKIAYLLYTGDRFREKQATELFFGITKLFQHKDPSLRQFVYIIIKELSSVAQDVIMITSSIMKDTATGSEVIYRPNAIRSLVRVIDANTVPAIERILTTAVVDPVSAVASAALVSAYHLYPVAKDVVSRWSNKAQDATTSHIVGRKVANSTFFTTSLGYMPSASGISQYHALALLFRIRQSDHIAVLKIFRDIASKVAGLSNSHAFVMYVRYVASLMDQYPDMRKDMIPLFHNWLKGKGDMVNLEIARNMIRLKTLGDEDLRPVVAALTIFLTSHRSAARFSAIRTLNELAMTRPHLLYSCNPMIESLITDANRSIATYAITTLLKTGNEESVDRLMLQIANFMSEIPDNFKIIVVDAIRSLCLKFPRKQEAMLSFLSNILSDEGGYEFKRAAIDAIFDMIKYIPESKEKALAELCEFIEDCEYPKIAVRILCILGEEGPKAAEPTRFIRYIYNRIMLENAIVRSAAISALTKFGVNVKDNFVKHSVRVILSRCLDDADDEVRDRAAFSVNVLDDMDSFLPFVKSNKVPSIPALERSLVLYVTGDKFDQPFDIEAVPMLTQEEIDAENLKVKKASTEITQVAPAPVVDDTAEEVVKAENEFKSVLESIPEFSSFGPVLKSSSLIEVTERETEYVVKAIKHVFEKHIVIQYQLQNTLTEVILENVTVGCVSSNENLIEEFVIPAPVAANEPVSIYVSFSYEGSNLFNTPTVIENVLRFTSKEIDPHTGEPEEEGYDDEYNIDDLLLKYGDFCIPSGVSNFDERWEQLDHEISAVYSLSEIESFKTACSHLVELLQMQPVDGTDCVNDEAPLHVLKLCGQFVSGGRVLAIIKMIRPNGADGVTIKLITRAEDEKATESLPTAFEG